MENILREQTAVVTGGASGIGRQISLTFADQGADVFIADTRREPREGGTPTDALIQAQTESDGTYIESDVTDAGSIAEVVEQAATRDGLDIMVNNAGIFRTESFLDVAPEQFDEITAVNSKGVFFGAQAAGRQMISQDRDGVILNLSSTAALNGSGDRVAYTGSKAAVRAMTFAMADRLGPEGIRVNAILPGLIETTMADWAFEADVVDEIEQNVPSRRLGTPTDVADAALFLASNRASYINGEALVIDGGEVRT